MRRIVVVQTAFLGDVVLTIPLLRELGRAHAGARIVVVAAPVGAEALSGQPFVDEIHVLDKRGRDRGPLALWALARRLGGADAAVSAQRSARTGLLVRASRAPRRVGFENAPGAWAYTEKVPWRENAHASLRYLELSRPLGGAPERADPQPLLEVARETSEGVSALLRESGIREESRVVALAPGSVWGTKRWVPEGFGEVVRGAVDRGLVPVLVGSGAERALCEAIAGGAGVPSLVLAGRLTIPGLAALLRRAEALVSNDSGAGHVASAVGTPVVTVFGPTVPAFGYAPFGAGNRIVEHRELDCRPCHRHGPPACPLHHFRCMREIEAKKVLATLDEVAGPRPGARPQGATGNGSLPAR